MIFELLLGFANLHMLQSFTRVAGSAVLAQPWHLLYVTLRCSIIYARFWRLSNRRGTNVTLGDVYYAEGLVVCHDPHQSFRAR